MRKAVLLIGALLIGALLILCILTYANDLMTRRPARDCPIRSLLLDIAPFPPGAIAEVPLSPAPEGPPESASVDIGWSDYFAIHEVRRVGSTSVAARLFRGRQERYFSAGRDKPWETPAVPRYRSPIADQYCLKCQEQTDVHYLCKMIAQYEEYYVELIVHVTPDTMTFQLLERVLRAIDERMAQCLGKALPTTPFGTATPAAWDSESLQQRQ